MAKEDESLFGQKLEEVGVSIYDKLLAQTERIGRELDKKLFAVCADFARWADQLSWHYTIYRTTTAADGKPRILELVNVGFTNIYIVGECNKNRRDLGMTVFVNPGYALSHRPAKKSEGLFPDPDFYTDAGYEPIGVAFNAPNVKPNPGNPFFLDERPENADSSYGWIRDTQKRFCMRRERYVRPGMEHLPDPIEKAREIVDMLQRGKVAHKRPGYKYRE